MDENAQSRASFRPDPVWHGGVGVANNDEPRCDPLEASIRLIESLIDLAPAEPPATDHARFGDEVIVEVIRGGSPG